MKIATWNVNSLRARQERVVAWLRDNQPDVVCLQETKLQDEAFPHQVFAELGYHASSFGQRTYNGVALLSRLPQASVERGFADDPVPHEARVIAADVAGLRVVCAYVVNGQSIGSDKYALKLRWLDAFGSWLREQQRRGPPLLVAGDFNIAPDDRDVHDPALWQGQVLCSEPERRWLRELLGAGMVDLLRQRSEDSGIFSWWDYRAGAFARDHGLRIDLILGDDKVARRCTSAAVDRQARKVGSGSGKPSDHAPVVAVLSDGAAARADGPVGARAL